MSKATWITRLALLAVLATTQLTAQKAGSEDKARKPLLGVVHTHTPRGVRMEKVMQHSAAERAGLRTSKTRLVQVALGERLDTAVLVGQVATASSQYQQKAAITVIIFGRSRCTAPA
jgi:predicted metalloprotease with PDZ domain